MFPVINNYIIMFCSNGRELIIYLQKKRFALFSDSFSLIITTLLSCILCENAHRLLCLLAYYKKANIASQHTTLL